MVADRLERLDPCGIERSFLASKGQAHWVEYQPGTMRLAPALSHDEQPAQRAYWQIGRPACGSACVGAGGSCVGRCWPAGPIVSTSQSESGAYYTSLSDDSGMG